MACPVDFAQLRLDIAAFTPVPEEPESHAKDREAMARKALRDFYHQREPELPPLPRIETAADIARFVPCADHMLAVLRLAGVHKDL